MLVVWDFACAAQRYGRLHDWLQWYSGGLVLGLKPEKAAAEAAKECGL